MALSRKPSDNEQEPIWPPWFPTFRWNWDAPNWRGCWDLVFDGCLVPLVITIFAVGVVVTIIIVSMAIR